MRTPARHVAGILVVTLFTVGLLGSGKKEPPATVPPPPPPPPTMITGTFTPQPKPDEIFTKPATAEMMRGNETPSIVLRVPTPGAKVTEEEQQYNVKIYNAIEKEFAKSGYIVRDRALFAKVLEQEVLDYSKIGSVTGTDLILELIAITRPEYRVRDYVDEKGAKATAPRDIVFRGAQLEFKLVSVKENDMVGSYTFHYAPCAEGCKQTFNADETAPMTIESELPLGFFSEAALRLIQELKSGR